MKRIDEICLESEQANDVTRLDKRAIKFLGSLLSGITGVPSAEMHHTGLSKI